jgi:ferredoxin
MQFRIDKEKCQGHGRCGMTYPELFDLDELGFGVVRADPGAAEDNDNRVAEVIANCPEHAISYD